MYKYKKTIIINNRRRRIFSKEKSNAEYILYKNDYITLNAYNKKTGGSLTSNNYKNPFNTIKRLLITGEKDEFDIPINIIDNFVMNYNFNNYYDSNYNEIIFNYLVNKSLIPSNTDKKYWVVLSYSSNSSKMKVHGYTEQEFKATVSEYIKNEFDIPINIITHNNTDDIICEYNHKYSDQISNYLKSNSYITEDTKKIIWVIIKYFNGNDKMKVQGYTKEEYNEEVIKNHLIIYGRYMTMQNFKLYCNIYHDTDSNCTKNTKNMINNFLTNYINITNHSIPTITMDYLKNSKYIYFNENSISNDRNIYKNLVNEGYYIYYIIHNITLDSNSKTHQEISTKYNKYIEGGYYELFTNIYFKCNKINKINSNIYDISFIYIPLNIEEVNNEIHNNNTSKNLKLYGIRTHLNMFLKYIGDGSNVSINDFNNLIGVPNNSYDNDHIIYYYNLANDTTKTIYNNMSNRYFIYTLKENYNCDVKNDYIENVVTFTCVKQFKDKNGNNISVLQYINKSIDITTNTNTKQKLIFYGLSRHLNMILKYYNINSSDINIDINHYINDFNDLIGVPNNYGKEYIIYYYNLANDTTKTIYNNMSNNYFIYTLNENYNYDVNEDYIENDVKFKCVKKFIDKNGNNISVSQYINASIDTTTGGQRKSQIKKNLK